MELYEKNFKSPFLQIIASLMFGQKGSPYEITPHKCMNYITELTWTFMICVYTVAQVEAPCLLAVITKLGIIFGAVKLVFINEYFSIPSSQDWFSFITSALFHTFNFKSCNQATLFILWFFLCLFHLSYITAISHTWISLVSLHVIFIPLYFSSFSHFLFNLQFWFCSLSKALKPNSSSVLTNSDLFVTFAELLST